jgi:F-type H+-transporting ATPase subunit gamma
MPNVRDFRHRIRSVKNTQQITRAMKMVASGRLRRAQAGVFSARPFARQMLAMLTSVAARTDQSAHPLLAQRPVEKVLLVLITADRGLCGAFNANLLRAAEHYLAEHASQQVSLLLVGRKGRDYFRRKPVRRTGEYIGLLGKLRFSDTEPISQQIIDAYTREEVDAVDFIYNEFKSIMVQRLTVERYLPIPPFLPPLPSPVPDGTETSQALIDYIYEQPPAEIFRDLLPRYVEVEVYRALLESQAAWLSAQMTAMDAATNNATELIETYTLQMNRARQGAITTEIIEIISGAAAL